MSKLIIENRTELSDYEIIDLVKSVIKLGRISNNNRQYCYATRAFIEEEYYVVHTDLNKKSDRFVIIKDRSYAKIQ